eukprot:TRINITY_DN66621_c0_g1_i1.p1 TRINITY_DN66621_c0_g1~~TRINITY_DN66621_c0_g1_i1.p1  ORF type:complete len:571 (+),score=109.35 TRINITY_DN66621_c0_g1_i1:93-1805(+)
MSIEDSSSGAASTQVVQEGEGASWLQAFAALQGAPWLTSTAVGDSHLLPFWNEEDEKADHADTIREFHTKPCQDFQRGFCAKHGWRGKSGQCISYHFDSQRRRSPVDPSTSQLTYWETPCPAWSSEMGYCCLAGDACTFAHGREEVSYHPAKYKTRLCNGTDCRGEGVCCFAHTEDALRQDAPARYSYLSILSAGQSGNSGQQSEMLRSRKGSGADAPPSQVASQKVRFCASYPNISQCRRGSSCAFAHARDEVQTPLLSLEEEEHEESAMTQAFFTRKFKTMWCPIGAQHDWQTCVYAHTYQDARRQPSIGYGPQPCPYWAKKDTRVAYSQRCPLGLRCPYAHGAKEQLYHPKYFRTVTCRDMQMKGCPRQRLCAFYHRRAERRKQQTTDTHDYGRPLPKEVIDAKWAQQFLNPPIFQDGELDEAPAPRIPGAFSGYPGFWPPTEDQQADGADSPRTQSTASDSEPMLPGKVGAAVPPGLLVGSGKASKSLKKAVAASTDPLATAALGMWLHGNLSEPVDAEADWAGMNFFYQNYLAGQDGASYQGISDDHASAWWNMAAEVSEKDVMS